MIFRPELAAKVLAGEKTTTRRVCSDNARSPWWRERCIYEEGKEFAVQPGRGQPSIGRAVVVACHREPLRNLDTNTGARREGFSTLAEFREAWEAINGSYDPDVLVWRVEFKVLA